MRGTTCGRTDLCGSAREKCQQSQLSRVLHNYPDGLKITRVLFPGLCPAGNIYPRNQLRAPGSKIQSKTQEKKTVPPDHGAFSRCFFHFCPFCVLWRLCELRG